MKPLCTTCLRLCLFVENPAQTAAPVETKFRRFRRGGDPGTYGSKWSAVAGSFLFFYIFFLRRLQGWPVRRHRVQTVGVHQLRLGWQLRSVHLWLLVELVELVPVRFQDVRWRVLHTLTAGLSHCPGGKVLRVNTKQLE